MPQTASNISNVAIGAASITLGGVSIGHTLGGAKFTFDRKLTELNVDKYGETPIDYALSGQNLMIEVTLAEPLVDFIATAIPESPNINGTIADKLGLGRTAGVGLRQYAQQLILHPLDRAVTDLTADIVIYKAVSTEKIELNYEVDKQRVFAVTWHALVDETLGEGFRLGQIGQNPIS